MRPGRQRAWKEERLRRLEQNQQQGSKSYKDRPPRPGQPLDLLDACLDLTAPTRGLRTVSSAVPPLLQSAKLSHSDKGLEDALAEVRQCRARGIQELRDKALRALAPCCPHHQHPAKLFKVKKAGPNKHRRFYVCSYPRGSVGTPRC